MAKFEIEVKKTLSIVFEVEAESIEETKELVHGKYNNEEIVLDSEDFIDTEPSRRVVG